MPYRCDWLTDVAYSSGCGVVLVLLETGVARGGLPVAALTESLLLSSSSLDAVPHELFIETLATD